MVIKRGDIFYADLRPVVGSEQGGIRPVLIIQWVACPMACRVAVPLEMGVSLAV